MTAQPQAPQWPHCIHLAGADGSGKTTQARALLALLREENIPARCVWLRFPHLVSAPLLAYARLRGCSYYEIVQGQRHGYWDFRRSWALSHLLPWALLVDTFLVALVKLYWPLARGWTVVCDRFVVDILVDLITGLGDESFDARQPGKRFFDLLPSHSRVVVIDLDSDLARQRCPELRGDRTHEQRRAAYLDIARRHGLPVVSSATTIDVTTAALMESLGALRNSSGMPCQEQAADSACSPTRMTPEQA